MLFNDVVTLSVCTVRRLLVVLVIEEAQVATVAREHQRKEV